MNTRAIGSGVAALAVVSLMGCERPLLETEEGGGVTGTDPGTGVVQPRPDSGAPADPNCQTVQLPPETQPAPASVTVAEACQLGMGNPQWGYPGGSVMGSDDDRAKIVGRWLSCDGAGGFAQVPHAGVEFGANGRWRLLAHDDAGTLVPASIPGEVTSGAYYLLSSGQLNVAGEHPEKGLATAFIKFTAGMDAVRFDRAFGGPMSGIYARSAPSPLNGRDNPPATTDGRCSMVGTWAVPANERTPVAPALTMSFDADGNFVAAPAGSNVCGGHTAYGTYAMLPGWFKIVTNVGLGVCAWWFSAAYPATFDEGCNHVTLQQRYDNCTGGRGTFNGTTTLTRFQ